MNRTLVFLIFIQMTHQRLKCLRFKSAHIHTLPYSLTELRNQTESNANRCQKVIHSKKKNKIIFFPKMGSYLSNWISHCFGKHAKWTGSKSHMTKSLPPSHGMGHFQSHTFFTRQEKQEKPLRSYLDCSSPIRKLIQYIVYLL